MTADINIEQSLKRGDHAKTDEITGAGTVKFYNPAGVLVGAGCNVDSGRRLGFDEKE